LRLRCARKESCDAYIVIELGIGNTLQEKVGNSHSKVVLHGINSKKCITIHKNNFRIKEKEEHTKEFTNNRKDLKKKN
jgi:hypothetical protein